MKTHLENQKTDYASAERDDLAKIISQMNKLEQAEFLDEVIAEIPMMFFILNDKRQIVYSNHLLAEQLGYADLKDIISLRPGEVLQCTHTHINEAGCGTTKFCRYCGVVNTLLKSDTENKLITGEAQLTTKIDDEDIANDFSVSSKPFIYGGERFFIVSLNDISHEKRKEQMERVFFHDLLNKAGSIDGLIDIITNHNPGEQQTEKYQSFIQRGMKELLQDISFQRDFLRAERGELIIRNQDLQTASILKNIADDFKGYLSNKSFNLVIDHGSNDSLFRNDPVIIIRILTNLTKNAIEAIEANETVTLKAEDKGNTIVFSVHNFTVMPEEIQLQLFKRSFSTKGVGRGIGTYSVKLFSEKYLKGKVWFNSTNEAGTTFFVELPKNI